MRYPFDAMVFDLDGTLIDSSQGIVKSFAHSFDAWGIAPCSPWSPALVGLPLQKVIAQQCASKEPAFLERSRQAFTFCYDVYRYRLSKIYSGIHAALDAMRQDKMRLFIATNKRIVPTQHILAHLGWGALVEGVFGADSH